MPWAYYNEIDRFAAQWLRELIKRGLIADGEVDERSIWNVCPDDVAGFKQCHWFGGIGVWSYALRQAGWPDDRPVWTFSCPCQSFSAAGKRGGFADERHLWPAMFHLISVCRPPILLGEQVASKDGRAWLDVVWHNLEAIGYSFAPTILSAAGFGAPHIRQRLYFVGQSMRPASERKRGEFLGTQATGSAEGKSDGNCGNGSPDASPTRLVGNAAESRCDDSREYGGGSSLLTARSEQSGGTGSLGNASGPRQEGNGLQPIRRGGTGREPHSCLAGSSPTGELADAASEGATGYSREETTERKSCRTESSGRGPTNGFWSDAVWIPCRDGKWRPTGPGISPLVMAKSKGIGLQESRSKSGCPPEPSSDSLVVADAECNAGRPDQPQRRQEGRASDGQDGCRHRPTEPGTFPLAHGSAARVGRLRGYGNAIVAPVATEFIKAVMEIEGD